MVGMCCAFNAPGKRAGVGAAVFMGVVLVLGVRGLIIGAKIRVQAAYQPRAGGLGFHLVQAKRGGFFSLNGFGSLSTCPARIKGKKWANKKAQSYLWAFLGR